ncbi:MAG TPA: biotin/lipoyl-binding protein [Bacteroidales bacterium]|nr:biotin/lipoyl-binding protein [Bacteroidales bacterium]
MTSILMIRKVKNQVMPGLVFASALTMAVSCTGGNAGHGEPEKIVTPVTVTSITKGKIAESLDLPAQSTFLNKSMVRSSTTGSVEKILVTYGDHVKTGQQIFTIKTREASVLGNSMRADTSLAFRGEIKIFASRDGIITSVSHQGGDFVQEGDELATISDAESFVFILDVPFEINSLVQNNRRCTMLFPDGRTVPCEIGGQLPEMDQAAQTIRYFIRIPYTGILPSNLNVSVRLVKRESNDAVILPRAAVLGNETQTEFWVMKLISDSVAVKVPVRKGIETTSGIEITDPVLSASERIILTGGYGLPDTANVVIR